MAVNFIPTVTAHHFENGHLVLETLDSDEQSDLISADHKSAGCTLDRKGDLLTDEQQEKLSLRERT